MRNLIEIKNVVLDILSAKPETRDNDDLLYLEILKIYGAEHWSVEQFFRFRKIKNIPPFESVRRTRQKAQAEFPELKGKRAEERMAAEKVFYDFARS